MSEQPMKIVNLTPHDVNVVADARHSGVTYPASGDVLRLGHIDLGTWRHTGEGVWVEGVEFHHLQNPPERVEGTWYISQLAVRPSSSSRRFPRAIR